MLFTIITVVYNASGLLKPTIESVLAQLSHDYEYLIADGKSEDDTVAVAEAYAPQFRKKGVRYVIRSQPDGGIYDAMNQAAACAAGDFILFLNAGDFFVNRNVLRDAGEKMALYSADIYYGDTILENRGYYKYSKAEKLERLWEEIPFCHQSVFVRQHLLRSFPFDTDYRICADQDFFLRCFRAGLPFCHLSMPVSVYLSGGYSASDDAFPCRRERLLIAYRYQYINYAEYGRLGKQLERRWKKRHLCNRLKKYIPSVIMDLYYKYRLTNNGWSKVLEECTIKQKAVADTFYSQQKGGGKIVYSYCTLFDRDYLNKGIVMLRSLLRTSKQAKIYVLAMDDKCLDVLTEEHFPRVVLISMDHFMTCELRQCQLDRSHAEFCWTCTAGLISYIFTEYGEKFCTYVDADMYFYQCPDALVQQLADSGKSVQIIKHGFKKTLENRLLEKRAGRFCVEFNTFKNDSAGRAVLESWRKDTIRDCSCQTAGNYGDQLYLDQWPEKYNCIHILDNEGAGVAPWNINRYRYAGTDSKGIRMICDRKKQVRLFFYHFHGMEYKGKNLVDIKVCIRHWYVEPELLYRIYLPYLKKLAREKERLYVRYGIDPESQIHLPEKRKKSRRELLQKMKDLSAGAIVCRVWILFTRRLKSVLWESRDRIKIHSGVEITERNNSV